MNAPAKVTSARDQYRPQVAKFVPGATGREVELRASMLLLRDQATARMRNCSDEAYAVCALIVRLATDYALKPMPLDLLEEVRAQAVRLATCASGLEMFSFKLAGGQDAGG